MGICGVGVGCGEGTGDGGAVFCGVDGDGASDRLIIGARDGDGDGGGRTGGVGCAGVIGGGVRKVTSRVSPSARSWKSEPGSKVKVPSLLLTTEPSEGALVMVKVWVSVVSASVAVKEPVTVGPSSVALMETAPATG